LHELISEFEKECEIKNISLILSEKLELNK